MRLCDLTMPCLSVLVASAVFAVAEQDAPSVPSGMPVTLHEIVEEPSAAGPVWRFRFIAPEIGGAGRAFDAVAEDMAHLCDDVAVPRALGAAEAPAQIVISLMAAPVAFGESSPDVKQFFEAYSIRDGRCMWEVF